jgi:hypothetical protein
MLRSFDRHWNEGMAHDKAANVTDLNIFSTGQNVKHSIHFQSVHRLCIFTMHSPVCMYGRLLR